MTVNITGQHNRRLKEIRKLRMRRRWRERSGRFVAEGEDLLSAADDAGWEPIERYCAVGSGLQGTEVEPQLLASASGIASGTRALAVYRECWSPKPAGPLCVYLHAVHDPGNVGAVLRGAEAFGAASIALGPGCADPFGPKAVRASMGAVFTVPLTRAERIDQLPGVKIALVPGQGVALSSLRASRVDLRGGTDSDVTLMVGSEREGLPRAAIDQADCTAHIPVRSNSLNAAMAATVALYELANTMEPR